MKKVLSLLLISALVLCLVPTSLAATDDGKLTIWTWDPTFNIAAMNIAKEMYQKEHPDAVIEIQEVLTDDIETAVTTAATAGDLSTLPDILLVQDNSFQKYATNYPEVYMDLTDVYAFDGFGAAKVAYSTLNGRNFGIPFDAGTVVGAYRTDYLEQAGYTIKDLEDIDWNRLIEIGKDVKAKTGYPMFSGTAGSADSIMIMLQSCGASMFNEDGSVNVKNNEALKEVIDIYMTMVREGIYVEVNSWDEYIGTLSNGSVVGTFQGCWILSTIMSLTDQMGKWDITNMPRLVNAPNATNYSNNGGSSWAIVNGKDTEMAVDFMQCYRSVEFYNAILPSTSAIATYAPAMEGEAYSAPSPFFNGAPVFATILEYGTKVPSNMTGPYYYDARNAVSTAMTNALNGANLDTELANAEDTVNFAMGF